MADPNLLAILDRMQQNHAKIMQLIINLVERLAPTNNQNNHQHFSSPPSCNNISPHHRYNISTNIISPSPHLQQRDNYSKILDHLPYGSKGENFNGVDEEINPFHGSKSLVSCDEDARYQHHTPQSACSKQVTDKKATTPMEERPEQPDELFDSLRSNENHQQHNSPTLNGNNLPPNQMATTPMEERLEQPEELVDRLVMVEESHEPNEEDDINTLTKNFETKLEVKADLLLPSKLLCSTNDDVIRSNYNDSFLQSGSTVESAGYASTRKFFSMFFPSKFFPKQSTGYDGIRKFNCDYSVSWKSCSQTAQIVTIQVSNSTRIREVLLVVTRVEPESVFVYNYKEVYKDKRKKTRT